MFRFQSPDVQFTVNDQPPLMARMSGEAWALLQDHWELDSMDAAAGKLAGLEGGKLHVRDLGTILWAMLRTHHPDVSAEQAWKLLDDMGVPAFVSLAVQCATASMPEGGGKDASANPPRRKLWSLGR